MFTTGRSVDMKNQKGSRLKAAIACASALLALGPVAIAQSGPGDSQGGQAASIEGTWILSIHRVAQGITFSALQSFTAGGVTVATGTIDRTPPPPISPLYGSWRRAGDNTYVASICFFVFDAAGNALVMFKTAEAFQMVDDNNLTGSGTGFVCDINGDHCVNINSTITITGKRLIAQGPSN